MIDWATSLSIYYLHLDTTSKMLTHTIIFYVYGTLDISPSYPAASHCTLTS